MNSQHTESITVKDEWESNGDKYRLVNKGAGPMELQILDGQDWRAESSCYVHGILCDRIISYADVYR